MSGNPCLYRRPSGIYAVRLVVPKRLRDLVGKGEIHASTGLRDWNTAKLAALKIQLHWRERFMALDVEKLSAGSPLLLGDGVIPILEAARVTGLSVGSLLGEMLNDRTPVYIQARNWSGWHVADLDAIERDYDGTFILNDVEVQGRRHVESEMVRVYDRATVIAALIADDIPATSLFLLSGRAAFFCDDEQAIALAACLAPKSAIERIRARLVGVMPPTSRLPTTSPIKPSEEGSVIVFDPITARHGKKRFSELFEIYKSDRKWGLDQTRRMTTEAGLFRDLMGDPQLGDIEKDTILDYAKRLAKLPTDIYQSKREFGVTTLHELIDIADQHGLEKKTEKTIKGHIGRLSEILNYGAENHMLRFNPAGDYKRGKGRTEMQRAQDERQIFNSDELQLIFSQDWFCQGKGEFSSKGWINWQPHYYWLPLLGLLTGGRLNELSQLYLDDICQSESDPSIWYLDFNLNQPDKIDRDDVDRGQDKSLKTVNAIRVVPLHDLIIRLGLPEYVAALKRQGKTQRLFPELTRNETKGYGKPAGSWFNERFLGERLGIERNGQKTFHSLRHCFLTAAERLDLSERVLAQLAGHERGKTQSMTRYAKDRSAEELKPLICKLEFPSLSGIAAFDCKAALRALKCSEQRKRSHTRQR